MQLPLGFSAAGIACGVKHPNAPKKDVALFVSDRPGVAAGVFTTNCVCGAPVKVSRERLPRSTARAILINSGNSNAATGDRGLSDARAMTQRAAELIGCPADDVLVASTGVIGVFLPMDRLLPGIEKAVQALDPSAASLQNAAEAMMTTDTVPKLSIREVELSGGKVRVTGVCKGAAMIAPNMATMLCAILTDVQLTEEAAKSGLQLAVRDSFNCISVDGHESTSDSVILLANGASGISVQTAADREAFQAALNSVAQELAQAIIHDAEGAHHFVQLDVTGCRNRAEAFAIAQAIANSPLVKTAICGADPNWGRIVSAAGYAGVPLQEVDMSLTVNGVELYAAGRPLPFDAAAVSKTLREQREVAIELRLTHGEGQVRFWTSDLTKEYVELNADYTT